MTATETTAKPPASSPVRLRKLNEPLPGDFGRFSGSRDRHAQRPPGQRGPARPSRRSWLRLRRSLLDSNCVEHGDYVQRRFRGFSGCSGRSPQNSAPGRGDICCYIRFAAVCARLLGDVGDGSHRGNRLRDFLLPHDDLRTNGSSEETDHLRNCGLCSRHRFRQ